MRSGMLPARVVHVHPTRVCNLACAHCYSSSAPKAGPHLDVARLGDALKRLRPHGYEVVSISGGEPLVYREMERLAQLAHESGYRVHLVTNGLLLSQERLARLREHVDLWAVSLDGRQEVHNRVRGRPEAFGRACRALELLSKADVPFGLAFGVSRQSLRDVPWAWEYARTLRASLLHLRPLVAAGRARSLDDAWFLPPGDLRRLQVLGDLLPTTSGDGPHVQVDLISTDELRIARGQHASLDPGWSSEVLSDWVNPLVIDEQGRVLAFTYGIHPAFTIAEIGPDFITGVRTWLATRTAEVVGLLDAAFTSAMGSEVPIDWFAHLTAVSHAMPSSSAVAENVS